MSVFTNPASSSREQAAVYTTAVLGLLGSDDALDVLAHTPTAVAAAIAGLADEVLVKPEADGKWSIRHTIQHLSDSELIFSYRVRMVLAHDKPPIQGYDQDLWAGRLHYDSVDATMALAEFSVMRQANVRLFRTITPAERERVGIHSERGEESVAYMLRLYAGHDLLHLRQIERIRNVVAPAT